MNTTAPQVSEHALTENNSLGDQMIEPHSEQINRIQPQSQAQGAWDERSARQVLGSV